MKEIKFRAWHEDSKSMIYVTDLCWFKEQEISEIVDGVGYGIHGKYHIMPYIGLHDMNGIEIYAGDIDKSRFIVAYCNGEKDFYGMNVGWYLQRDDFESWLEVSGNIDISIVGNIFQNPGLGLCGNRTKTTNL
ncbi:MAG: hypothetical protein H6Q67_1873 [Firmicutes bacterium]|nr:hypothetical protein [Bacillota bacterium]